MQSESKATKQNELEAIKQDELALRKLQIPVTAQRLSVLSVVRRFPHAKADEVVELVKEELGAISRQSVYNVLGFFAEKGLLRKIQPAGSAARYENRVNDNHHHVVCRSCGEMADVDCAVGKTPCLNASNTAGYIIDEAEVVYWGTCPQCQNKNTSNGATLISAPN